LTNMLSLMRAGAIGAGRATSNRHLPLKSRCFESRLLQWMVSDDGPMLDDATSTGAVVRKPPGKEPAGS
jgi:hypothetical protein